MARRIASGVWLLVALALAPLQSPPLQAAHKWEGIYAVEGVNPDDTTYTGLVEVTRIPETEVYHLLWVLADGEIEGIGYEDGDLLIVVALAAPMVASIHKNGKSRWLARGFEKPSTETWARLALKQLPPRAEPRRPLTLPPATPPPERRMPHRGETQAVL